MRLNLMQLNCRGDVVSSIRTYLFGQGYAYGRNVQTSRDLRGHEAVDLELELELWSCGASLEP